MLGRYVLLRRIARGGMGEVYLASTLGLEGAERPVVVKQIRREHIGDKSFHARFLDEARVQAQLQNRGVAQVIDASTDDATGEPYVVVEYVDGRSLGDIRARSIQLGIRVRWPEAVAVAIMVGEALGYVHDRADASGRPLGIVHRDLSPQNVMIGFDGDVKLIDFGTARGQNRRCHTVAGVVFAKPGYVAPEVANGDSGDGRVDLYALGVMLWELCAGRRFLQGDSSEHMALVAKDQLSLPPIAAKVGAPERLDSVIAKLTAFDRDRRYRSGRDAARDLAAILSEAPGLESGERGVRARAQDLMQRLFGDEPLRARRAFAHLLENARIVLPDVRTPATAARAVVTSDEPDDVLPGTRYRLLAELGRGSSSVVYEAEHIDLARRVAVKVLEGSLASSKEYAARFRREAKTLSKLSHPSLVELVDFGQASDGRLFCVMELCEGRTLEQVMAAGEPFSVPEALEVGLKVLRALEVAHASGLTHRDIKPQNVFLTKDGGIKLLDFGLAVTAEDVEREVEREGKVAMGGVTLFGTPEYMAPEQVSGGRVDARADLYSVGCTLYELLTGSLPFAKDSAVKTLEAKVKGSPERLTHRAPERDIPPDVDALVLRALARHPSLRYQTAEEMARAVEGVLGMTKRRRRAPKLVAAAALALGVGLFGLGFTHPDAFDAAGQRARAVESHVASWFLAGDVVADNAGAPARPHEAGALAPPPAAAPDARAWGLTAAPTDAAAPADASSASSEPSDEDEEPALAAAPEEDDSAVGSDAEPPPPTPEAEPPEAKPAPPKPEKRAEAPKKSAPLPTTAQKTAPEVKPRADQGEASGGRRKAKSAKRPR